MSRDSIARSNSSAPAASRHWRPGPCAVPLEVSPPHSPLSVDCPHSLMMYIQFEEPATFFREVGLCLL